MIETETDLFYNNLVYINVNNKHILGFISNIYKDNKGIITNIIVKSIAYFNDVDWEVCAIYNKSEYINPKIQHCTRFKDIYYTQSLKVFSKNKVDIVFNEIINRLIKDYWILKNDLEKLLTHE